MHARYKVLFMKMQRGCYKNVMTSSVRRQSVRTPTATSLQNNVIIVMSVVRNVVRVVLRNVVKGVVKNIATNVVKVLW